MTRSKVLLVVAVLLSGCAQGSGSWRWTEGPPAAPGSGMGRPSAPSTAAASPAVAPAQAEHVEPFSTEERQRITQVEPWVEQAARSYDLSPALIHGVVWVESRHNPRAKSHAGARGLMQLMPATANAMARQMGRTRAKVYDPEFNVMAGSLYLANLMRRYDGDTRLALAAYNAGAGNVDKWLREDGELPPKSVRYVELVMDAQRRFEARRDGAPAVTPKATVVARKEPAERPALIPEPPPPVDPGKDEIFYDDELGAVPRYVVVAPEPGANKRPPPPEPPLVDTPYAYEEEPAEVAARRKAYDSTNPAPASDASDDEDEDADDNDADAPDEAPAPAPVAGLPSIDDL